MIFGDCNHPVGQEDIIKATSFAWDVLVTCLQGAHYKARILPGVTNDDGASLSSIEFQLCLDIRLENIHEVSKKKPDDELTRDNNRIVYNGEGFRIRFEEVACRSDANKNKPRARPLVRAVVALDGWVINNQNIDWRFGNYNIIGRRDFKHLCLVAVHVSLKATVISIPSRPNECRLERVARYIALETIQGRDTLDLITKARRFLGPDVSKAALAKAINAEESQARTVSLSEMFEMEAYVPRPMCRLRALKWRSHTWISACAEPRVEDSQPSIETIQPS